MNDPVLLVCCNRSCFDYECRQRGLNPRSRDVVCIMGRSDMHGLLGRRPSHFREIFACDNLPGEAYATLRRWKAQYPGGPEVAADEIEVNTDASPYFERNQAVMFHRDSGFQLVVNRHVLEDPVLLGYARQRLLDRVHRRQTTVTVANAAEWLCGFLMTSGPALHTDIIAACPPGLEGALDKAMKALEVRSPDRWSMVLDLPDELKELLAPKPDQITPLATT